MMGDEPSTNQREFFEAAVGIKKAIEVAFGEGKITAKKLLNGSLEDSI